MNIDKGNGEDNERYERQHEKCRGIPGKKEAGQQSDQQKGDYKKK